MGILFVRKKEYGYFAVFPAPICLLRLLPSGGHRQEGWGTLYIDKDVYLTFCLWLIRISQVLNSVKNKAAVDVHGYVYTLVVPSFGGAIRRYAYRRGLLRCSFRLSGQCESLDKRDE